MFKLVILTALACLLAGGVFTVLSFISFDRLLRQLCAGSEAAWIQLGRPAGFFWIPPGTTSVSAASRGRTTLYSQWAAGPDEPFAGSRQGIARLRLYKRIGTVSIALGLLQLAGAIALLCVG
jgi:hypothetical protein